MKFDYPSRLKTSSPLLFATVSALLITSTVLVGCGSSSKSDTAAPKFAISGKIVGKNSNSSIQLSSQDAPLSLTQNNNSFTTGNIFSTGSYTLKITNSTTSQNCIFDSSSTPSMRLDVNNIDVSNANITCYNNVALSGRITNLGSNDPVTNANINVQYGDIVLASVSTNQNGDYTANVPALNSRLVVNVDSPSTGTGSNIVNINTQSSNIVLQNIDLLPATTISFDSSKSKVLAVDGIEVATLPANAFVRPDGSPATGTITAKVSLIDPSANPERMPGNYETKTSQGEIKLIESYGAVDYKFWDANGKPLQLAANKNASINIPLAAGQFADTAPSTIPLFYYNENTGYWVEQGRATLVTDPQTLQSYYKGDVTHFTVWNADQVYLTVNILGKVVDDRGLAMAGVRILVRGIDFIGSSEVYTDSLGRFSIPTRRDSLIILTAISGSRSNTLELSSGSSDTSLASNIVLSPSAITAELTWGIAPEDLDSHLIGPSLDSSNPWFHLFYADDKIDIGNQTNNTTVFLDVDDTSSFGPEVITIPRTTVPGAYYYYVQNYSLDSEIIGGVNGARVVLNVEGARSTFVPPQGTPNTVWLVAKIVIDVDGKTTVVPLQQWKTEADMNRLLMGTSNALPRLSLLAKKPVRAPNKMGYQR